MLCCARVIVEAWNEDPYYYSYISNSDTWENKNYSDIENCIEELVELRFPLDYLKEKNWNYKISMCIEDKSSSYGIHHQLLFRFFIIVKKGTNILSIIKDIKDVLVKLHKKYWDIYQLIYSLDKKKDVKEIENLVIEYKNYVKEVTKIE